MWWHNSCLFISMLSLWKKLSNIGVRATQTLAEKKQIRLLNQVVSIIVIGLFSRLFMDLVSQDWVGFGVLTIMITICSLTVGLQYFQKFDFARGYFTTVFILLMTGIIMLTGKELGGEFSFFTSGILVLVFFEEIKTRTTFFLFIVCCYILTRWFLVSYEAPLSFILTDISFHFMFFANGICMVLMTMTFLKENQDFNKRTLELLSDLKEKNKSLEVHQTQIAHQNKELESTNKELERFAFVASHDLKTPLRNINSFLQLLKRKLRKNGEQSEEVMEYIDFATNSARQMHYLIQDILEYSRLNEKGIQYGEIDLNEIISKIKTNLQTYIADENAVIEVVNLPIIKGNESQLTLLFQNLIENAIKYNEEVLPQIQIKSEESDSEYIISVADNGIGIDQEYSEKIFEMFTRLHNQEHYQGSGIGLAICQKIATHHGGSIQLKSELNKGSEFIISFPKQSISYQTEKETIELATV